MHVLVTAATRHDATREIAEAIASGLAADHLVPEGEAVDIAELTQPCSR